MSHPNTRDLLLEGNPVHEESLAVARLAGADFIANVTLDGAFRATGVFCGDLEAAHAAAVGHLRAHVGIPVEKPYDLVVTHGGFFAQNHYQAAKAGVAALGALLDSGGSLAESDVASIRARVAWLADGPLRNTAPSLSCPKSRSPFERVSVARLGTMNATVPAPGAFKVKFLGLFTSDYLIFGLDDADYQWAIVGNNNRKFLWFLSRTPEVAPEVLGAMKSIAESQGYDLSKLYIVP